MFIAWTGSDSVSVAKPRNRGWADRGQKVLCRASGSGSGSGTRDRGARIRATDRGLVVPWPHPGGTREPGRSGWIAWHASALTS